MGYYYKEGFFKLGVLLGLPLISLIDLLHLTSEGFNF